MNCELMENVCKKGSIIDRVGDIAAWEDFLQYKLECQHINSVEEKSIKAFLESGTYARVYEALKTGEFSCGFPVKRTINKVGTQKKRVVYTFDEDVNILLKFIAAGLYEFDDVFASNCYAFRRGFGVKNALHKLSKGYGNKYCLKVDISDYFNSIDVNILIHKLDFLKSRDRELYAFLVKLLKEERVITDGTARSGDVNGGALSSGNFAAGKVVTDRHGAMAGVPVSAFFANVYLTDVDRMFGNDYFRYSDDILLFADSKEELSEKQAVLYDEIDKLGLSINHSKERMYEKGESWEFLGFAYCEGKFDLSEGTKKKIKAKIKRKADALRRWQRKKGLAPEKAAVGFINAMNKKFYGKDGEDDFTWKRWFFPCLSTDKGLREIDEYMQQYIRYCVTGRHYKGNYRIDYGKLKEWGYKSLVHEYYAMKKQDEENAKIVL